MVQRSSRPTQFRAVESDGKKQIECYFAVFSDVYQWAEGCTETIDPHAFDKTLGGDIRALVNHDTTLVLGRTTAKTLRLSVDDHGLKGVIDINEQDQDAMNLYARVQRGDVNQCSFGFDIVSEELSERGDGTYNWHITEVILYEVTIATFPAYERTEANARSQRASVLLNIWKKRTKERIEHVKTAGIAKTS